MPEESSNGQGLTELVHQNKRESPTRHKTNGKESRANGSEQETDALSKSNSLVTLDTKSSTALERRTQNRQIAAKAFDVAVANDSTVKISLSENARMFGTGRQDSGIALARQVCALVPTAARKPDLQGVKGALSLVQGIGPKDDLEGLLAVQMVGAHNLAMEFLKRASAEGQSPVLIEANVNHATKLMRTFTAQMEALNRHRGKTGQQMVVGNVNVGEGGQAIVGTVSHNGREKDSRRDDPDKVE
jgi:hypothetical protein